MSITEELEAELLALYTVREPSKARPAFVRQLLERHPAEHIAVSLAAKYGAAALWEAAPRWAMVAQAAAPGPGEQVAGLPSFFLAHGHKLLLGFAVALLLWGLL